MASSYDDGDPDADALTDAELAELEELSEKSEEELSAAEITSKTKLSVKRRFDFPTWVVVFEFQNREGRRADCLAMNCKASRNFPLVGFEFKASRSDWLSEKRDADKSDLFVQLCDEWYVVAGKRGIVEEEELPDGWGLLELKPSGRLYKIVESDLGEQQDRELDRRFFTRFMRRAIGDESNFSHDDIKEAEKRGYERAMDKAVEDHLDRETTRMKEKAEIFDELKDRGLPISRHMDDDRIERLDRAHRLVRNIESDRHNSLERQLEYLQDHTTSRLEEIAETCEELQDDLQAVREITDNMDDADTDGSEDESSTNAADGE